MSPSQIFSILLRRSWIICLTLLATMTAVTLVLWLVPPRFEAQATATIDPSQTDPITGQSAGASLRFLQGNMVALAKSQKVAIEVVKRLNLTSSQALINQYRASDAVGKVDLAEWIANEILRNLDAKFNEGTNVLVITYKWSDRLLAAQIANNFLAAFIDTAVEQKVAGAQQTAQWFEPQSDKLRAEVEELRAKMNQFQRAEKIAPVGNGDTEVLMLQQVTTELSQAKSEILKIESMLRISDESIIGADGDGSAQQLSSPLLQSLKNSLSSTVAEASRLQNEVGGKNPKLIALLATQKSIKSQIAAEIQTIRRNLDSRLAGLKSQVTTLEKARSDQLEKLIGIQGQRDQMTQFLRDLEVKQERLNLNSRASAQARLQGQLSFSNITVLDKASAPVSASFPKPIIMIPMGIACGFALGLIFALIAEALNRRVRVVSDLDFATAAPNLGVLLSAPVTRRAARQQRLALTAQ